MVEVISKGLLSKTEERELGELASWCMETLSLEEGYCTIVVLNDTDMQTKNAELLGHDYPTDVISLDMSSGPIACYELYLGMDEIRRNAIQYGTTESSERERCCVHGLLHMAGWDDTSAEERQRMNEEESRLLKLFHVEHYDG